MAQETKPGDSHDDSEQAMEFDTSGLEVFWATVDVLEMARGRRVERCRC